jgi:large subunit ribosomal protein L28
MYGNKVSHANNKTKRRFLPNLRMASFMSDKLGTPVRVRLSANAIRTVEKRGGIDSYLIGTCSSQLSPKFRKMKKMLIRRTEIGM